MQIQPPAPEGLGTVLQMMVEKGTQSEVVRLVRQARVSVLLLGYTYDLPELQAALIEAAGRRVGVKVGLDHRTTLSGRPRDQQQYAQQLQAHHIPVTLMKGAPPGTGVQEGGALSVGHRDPACEDGPH